MKTHVIIALAAAVLAGICTPAQAGDDGYRSTASQVQRRSRTIVESVAVPLLFYTSPRYSSSMYGSPEPDSSASVPTYFGSSAYSSIYRRYQYNPWYADQVRVRYRVVGAAAAADVQLALARQGYYGGAIDGVLGPMSQTAIRRYQQAHGLGVTGAVDESLLRSLGIR